MYKSHVREVNRDIDKVSKRALRQIGQFIQGDAKRRSPVDTGRLRNSIDFIVNIGKRFVLVGTNVLYAIYPEFGTRRMKEQPYLRPAFKKNRIKIQKIAEEAYRGLNR